MTIKELMESKLYDENEQVVVILNINGDINSLHRLFTGKLSNIPTELQEKIIEQISAMGESRRKTWNLNKYGWIEIWVESGD